MSKRCRLFGEPRSPIRANDIPSLRAAISDLQDQIDGLNIKITFVNDDLAQAERKLTSSINMIKAKVETLEKEIPSLLQQLRGVNSEMNRLYQVNLDNQTAIRALTERLDHYLSLPRT